MLNYIWAGLIVASLAFALISDTTDIVQDTYRNSQPLSVELVFPDGYNPDTRRQDVNVRIDSTYFREFYATENTPDSVYAATLIHSQDGFQLRFPAGVALPEPLATIEEVTNPRDRVLQGELLVEPASGQMEFSGEVLFAPVRFVNMNNISSAALSFATTAAEIALGLIGILALFLGLMKIGEDAGIINAMVRFVRPVLRPLFPQIPEDHPAFSMIALNMTANVFGLGNAATPFGIKAMEELQKLNPSEDTATDPMVMLLAINTSGVQLVPPVLLMAVMGLQINQLIFPIIFTTGITLFIAIVTAKLLGRLKIYRNTDPNRSTATETAD